MLTLFVPKVDASKRGCVDRLINAITKLDENNKSQRKNSRSEITNGRKACVSLEPAGLARIKRNRRNDIPRRN